MSEYTVVVDPAKKRDFTSLFIVRQTPEIIPGARSLRAPDRVVNFLDVVHIDKFNNLSYPKLVEIVAARCGHRDIVNNHDLLVDGTGIGEAVVDLMRDKGLNPMPIVFTGGNQVTQIHAGFGEVFTGAVGKLAGARMVKELHVPKADLIAAGQLIMQQDRLRVARLAWEQDFKDQLLAFKGKVNDGGRVKSAEAETEKDHDDLVVCFLMAAWWMLSHETMAPDQVLPDRLRRDRDYEPADFY